MRKLLLGIILFFLVQYAHAECDYGQNIFDWTGRSPLELSQWWSAVSYGANITGFYTSMDRENLYLKFEIEEREKPVDSFTYSFRLSLNSEVNYIDVSLKCDQIIQLLEKPRTGATINWTASPSFQQVVQDNFQVSVHQDSIELAISLDFLEYPTEAWFNMVISSQTGIENELNYEGSIDLCLMTGATCGNAVCEEGENDNKDICRYCPSDCSGLDLTCPLSEPLIDWSDALVLGTSNIDDVPEGTINGTDFAYLKAKVDKNNLYLRLELDEKEVPHENVSYGIRFGIWENDIEYINLKIDCQGLSEIIEARSSYVSPTNLTSNPAWAAIKNNFTVALTEHAIDLIIPWYTLYYPSSLSLNAWSIVGADDINYLSSNTESLISLFGSSCGDDICVAAENDSSNRYQYCLQDCPDAPIPLCGNGVCDEGEDQRWDVLQCVDDCFYDFGKDQYPDNGSSDSPLDGIIGLVVVLTVFFVFITLMRKGFRRLTSGRRKKSDMKKRVVEIDKEKKDLQKKFMETRISEADFKEKMESLDREKQNLDLELEGK